MVDAEALKHDGKLGKLIKKKNFIVLIFFLKMIELFLMLEKEQRLGMFGLILIAIFLTADQAALVPNYLLVEAEFGVGHAQMGAISSVFIIVGALTVLLWGWWVDKYSRKKLLTIGVLLDEIPCFLTAFAQSYTQLFITRALTGLGMGVILPVGSSLLGDYFPSKERGKGFAWFSFAIGLGYLLGAVIAGMIGPKFSWRYPFVIAAVPNFILIFLFYFFVKEPKRGEAEPELKKSLRTGAVYTYKVQLCDFKRVNLR
ncbi:MFS transporter [Candidatus Aerophobetes bacterium]|nr:MFS transporter [Candidatus Aerophobetes bacterium]